MRGEEKKKNAYRGYHGSELYGKVSSSKFTCFPMTCMKWCACLSCDNLHFPPILSQGILENLLRMTLISLLLILSGGTYH